MFDAGDRILVRAIAQPGVSSVNLYLPGGPTEVWYDIETPLLYYGVGNISVAVTLDSVSQIHCLSSAVSNHSRFIRFQFSIGVVPSSLEKIRRVETQRNKETILTPFTFLQIRFVSLLLLRNRSLSP